MAREGDMDHPNGERETDRSHVAALEQRVARLELELAQIQRKISGEAEVPATAMHVAPPPLPAPPPPVQAKAEPETVRLVSEAWASKAHRVPVTAMAARSQESLESRLGSQIFNRIAIVLILIGTAYGLKLAVDRDLIGHTGRVIVGLIAGAALVLWSERFRKKGFAAFSYSLKAVGSGVLYLSLWAGFRLYHLLPAEAALGLMILVTAWNAYMAWVQDSELLAVYALAGGFTTPMLLSTGGNHEIFIFTYLLAIDVATAALVRLKTWPRLLLGTFPLTVAFFVGWYSEFYQTDALVVTSLFIVLFGVVFGSVPIRRPVSDPDSPAPRFLRLATLLEDILLPIANAAFVALAFYSVLQDSGDHDLLPWAMIALGALYLALMRVPQTKAASAIHLSLSVVLLTIAIPLKASGHWITVSWLVEGLALLWVATRLAPTQEKPADRSDTYVASTLRGLASAALLLGFCGVFLHLGAGAFLSVDGYFTSNTGTALTGVVVFAVAAWLALRSAGKAEAPSWMRIVVVAFFAIDLTAALLALRELLSSGSYRLHPPFQSADFATALTGLAIFAAVIAVMLQLARENPSAEFWTTGAAVSTIAFNVIAVLTGVREIEAIWDSSAPTADSVLQQALAISAFLMLYGAVLLAVGFWRRSGFLRWQALLLLVFTIIKTFLYDMRNLSQGYRVASILGLGVLLMAISFAYQKDLLYLREPAKPLSTDETADPDLGAAK
ncbi:MAG TPA: DUF2339 domain-containing protein [Acidobacteriaceae bacterium]